MFLCIFSEIFQNIYSVEHLQTITYFLPHATPKLSYVIFDP